jgi:hypothetical protein
MRRSAIILMMILLAAHAGRGQNVKVKKDAIYLDNNQVATYEGKSSAFKGVDLQIKNNEGQHLFDLKHVWFKNDNPTIAEMRWQQVTMVTTGQAVRFTMEKPIFSDKKIFEILLEKTGKEIFNGELESALGNDQSEQIVKDSTEIANEQVRIAEILTNSKVARNAEDEIRMKSIKVNAVRQPAEWDWTVYQLVQRFDIYQGEVLLGWITKEKDVSKETSTKVKYSVYQKLESPTEFKGKTIDSLLAASAVFSDADDIIAFISIFMNNKRHYTNIGDQIKIGNLLYASKDIALFMIEQGYL